MMKKSSVLTVCLSPTLQKTLVFSGLEKDKVNRSAVHRLDTAGKGINAARVLLQLGKNCCHLTQLGGALRPLFLELCAADGVKVEWVESSSPIRFCYTLIDRTEKTITELVEESEKVGEGTGERLLQRFSQIIPEYSSLIIGGTKAAGFSDTLIPDMVRIAKSAGCRVLLDIRGKDLLNSLPFGPDIIKPNLNEFLSTFAPELVSQKKSLTEKEIKKRAEEIWAQVYKEYPCTLVLTRETEPVWYAEKGVFSEFPVKPVEPVNTTGSGDAFTAGLAAALEDGAPLQEAIALGARCGAMNAVLLRPGVIKQ